MKTQRVHRTAVVLLSALAIFGTGCNFFSFFDLLAQYGDAPGQNVSDNTVPDVGRNIPDAVSGAVLVKIVNPTSFDANATVVMRVLGTQVHAATRFVPAGAASIFVGPDNSDTVDIEATLFGAGGFAPPSARFVLGQDFQSGDVIRYEIAGPPEEPDRPVPDENLGELTVAVLGLNAALFATPGDLISFQIQTSQAIAATTISVFADPDATPNNGNELLIIGGVSALSVSTIQWDTTGVPPGTYRIYSEASDETRFTRSPSATGTITILDQIAVEFLPQDQSPSKCLGDRLTQSVRVTNVSPAATYTFFLDPDGVPASGDETSFGDDTPASVVDAFGIDLSQVALGDMFVYVEVVDAARLARFVSPDVFQVFIGAFVSTSGLENDITIAPGDSVPFSVIVSDAAAGATFDVTATASDPNAAVVSIVQGRPAKGDGAVVWNTAGVKPGSYQIAVGLVDPNNPCAGEVDHVAPGIVRISRPPLLAIYDPNNGAIFTLDEQILLDWDAADPDDDALISFYLDVDGDFNGNEILLIDGISEDSQPSGPMSVATPPLAGGSYVVLGTIADSASFVVAVGPTICLTERVIGVYDLGFGPQPDAIAIRGVPLHLGYRNELFGWSLDISRDIDGQGGTDILIGDPNAFVDTGEGFAPVGVAYYHALDPNAPTPQDLTAADLKSRIHSSQFDSGFGAATAFVTFDDPNDPNDGGVDVLCGAPLYRAPQSFTQDGAVFTLDGAVVAQQPGDLDVSDYANRLDGEADSSQLFGWAAVALEDVDGDGVAETAAGAPLYDQGRGRVVILPGGAGRPSGSLNNLGKGLQGTIWNGVDPNDAAGMAVADAGDFDLNLFGDVLIGAPGADGDAGRVYLLLGDPNFIDSQSNSLEDVGNSQPGTVFIGQPGERAGESIATIFANGDNRPDLLIGAPAANSGAGRVYLIYNTPALLAGPVQLSDVGGAVPGVVIDGLLPGDLIGAKLANVGDFDKDGRQDFAIGAPSASNGRGKVFVIYGDVNLDGANLLSRVATCERVGFELIGAAGGDRLGSALSGGDVNGDGFADIGIGAPGVGTARGTVYILLGDRFGP